MIYMDYMGDRNSLDFVNLIIYLKCVWFLNGIYYYYGLEKFVLGFILEFLKQVLFSVDVLKFFLV